MQSMRRPFLYVVFCGMAVLGTFREQVAMGHQNILLRLRRGY